jgi:energy-coupling factor transporter ATP-binding protein EcfA2
MITELRLNNFRCFQDSTIAFKDLSIVVGKNNAGKSTLIEALRIVSIVTNRATHINYVKQPSWTKLGEDIYGIRPSIENLDISKRNIFHLYGDPPAQIIAYFENKCRIEIFIGIEAEIFAAIFDMMNRNVASKGFAANLRLSPINILPQISPLLREEKIIKYRTVQRNSDTNLSSRNFRNQLMYYPTYFSSFKGLAEMTWHGLVVEEIDGGNGMEGQSLNLLIRDGNFVSEIGWMGHGLQMWLQTMWFLAACDKESTVILDEPDVYMHADLQRKLIRFVRNRFKQVMIATHSIEIMAEVDADSILPIDSTKEKMSYANKSPVVQEIINKIGSVHNIEIARLFSQNKFLIVEGDTDDVKILSILQSKAIENTLDSFETLPKTFIEGWGGWQRVIGSNKVFKDNQSAIKVYCIMDSDYHTKAEIHDRYKEATKAGLNLQIWKRKEIENYLIVPASIFRLIQKSNRTSQPIDIEIVEHEIKRIVEQMKTETIDNISTEILARDKSKGVKNSNHEARELFESRLNEDFLSPVPGKELISALSRWASDRYKVGLNSFKIAREIQKHEIHSEVLKVITAIEQGVDFSR